MSAKRYSPYTLSAGISLIAGAAFAWTRCSHDQPTKGTSGSRTNRHAPGADSNGESLSSDSLSSKQPREQETEAARRLREKLDSIILPVIDFDDTSFEEAIDFLRVRAAELDPDPDPSFIGALKTPDDLDTGDIANRRIPHFSERNISMWKVLKRIASDCRMKIKPTDQGIELIPLSPPPVDDAPAVK